MVDGKTCITLKNNDNAHLKYLEDYAHQEWATIVIIVAISMHTQIAIIMHIWQQMIYIEV